MSGKTNWRRIGLFAFVGILLGGGIAAYFVFLRPTPARSLAAGEKSYEAGVSALDSGDGAQAAQHFDEAILQANKVIDALRKEEETNRSATAEERTKWSALAGRAFWLKAQALRDQDFAEALADGKPIEPTRDTTTGQHFRAFVNIRDAEKQEEAKGCLIEAAVRLSDNAEIQAEMLRTLVMHPNPNVALLEKICHQMLALDPHDTRANYEMANYHYNQPAQNARGRQGEPLPLEKRSLKRMLEARGYVDTVKKSKLYRYWRTTDLETRIALWLRDYYSKHNRLTERQQEEKRIREILVDANNGVVARARDDKELLKLTIFDARAVLNLHKLALEEIVRDAKREDAERVPVRQYLESTLAVCQEFGNDKAPAAPLLEDSLLTAEAALTVARPVLAEMSVEEWDRELGTALSLAKTAKERKLARPALFAGMVHLLNREAQLAAKRKDTVRKDKFDEAAGQWLADGLKIGEEAKLKPEQMIELQALSAERKALRGNKESFKPELDILRKAGNAQTRLADFLEGIAAEREGRLDRARKLLEQADQSGSAFDVNMALGNIYLALGQPEKALQRLDLVAKAYNQVDTLSDRERAWVFEFIRERADLNFLLVAAHLGKASRQLAENARQNPGKPFSLDMVKADEDAARDLIGAMPPHHARTRAARQTLIVFLAQTNRRAEAAKDVAAARKDFPDSLELLQIDVALQLAPAPGKRLNLAALDAKDRDKADALIEHFRKATAEGLAGKLFWATWLLQTARADQAVAFLEDPANFPGEKGDQYKRVLALALIRKGEEGRGLDLLRHLPNSPDVDATLIQLAGSPEEQAKLAEQALARYERNGVVCCLNATAAFNNKNYAKAADEFFKALEYTRVRNTADQGLRVSLLQFAQKDPVEARKTLTRMLTEAPKEKSLYLAYAYVALQLDDVGNAADGWERTRNMATALNVWEQMHLRDGGERTAGALTRAEFWVAANRSDLAWLEIQRAMSGDTRDERALVAAVTLAADSQDLGIAEQGKQYAAALRAAKPNSVRALLVEAGFLEAQKKNAEAAAAIETILTRFPDEQEPYLRLYFVLLQLNDRDRLKQHVARWQKKFPDTMACGSAAVTVAALTGPIDQARAQAAQLQENLVTRAASDLDKARRPVGIVEAKWQEDKTAQIDRLRRDIQLELVRAYHRAKAYDEEEAILQNLLKRQPDDIAVMTVLANLHIAKNDWNAAQTVLEQIMAKDGNQFVAGNNLAWLLAAKLDKADKAREIVDRLRLGRFSKKPIPGDRLNADFLDTIGVVYRKVGGTDICKEMVELFEAGRKRYPGDPRLHLHLGHAYAGLEQMDKARDMYAAAISLARQDRCRGLTQEQRDKIAHEAEAGQRKLVQN